MRHRDQKLIKLYKNMVATPATNKKRYVTPIEWAFFVAGFIFLSGCYTPLQPHYNTCKKIDIFKNQIVNPVVCSRQKTTLF